MESDGMDDVSVMLNATPKSMEGQIATDKLLFSLGGGILCAKASMLLQVLLQAFASVFKPLVLARGMSVRYLLMWIY